MQTLEWAVSGQVKLQDFFYVMMAVSASSKEGLDMTWNFYKSNFEQIRKLVKDMSPSIMDAVISVSTSGYCTEEMAKQIEQFFEEHQLPLNKRKISQILEEIRSNAGFAQRSLTTDVSKPEFWKELQSKL